MWILIHHPFSRLFTFVLIRQQQIPYPDRPSGAKRQYQLYLCARPSGNDCLVWAFTDQGYPFIPLLLLTALMLSQDMLTSEKQCEERSESALLTSKSGKPGLGCCCSRENGFTVPESCFKALSSKNIDVFLELTSNMRSPWADR